MAVPNDFPTVEDMADEIMIRLKKNLPYDWWRDDEEPAIKLLTVIAAELASARWFTESLIYARSIDHAWDYALDLVASNVDLVRLDEETDDWLRERIKFAVFMHHLTGAPDEIRKSIAWFVGIKRQNLNWEDDYLPKVQVHPNRVPFWPYQDVEGIGKDLMGFMLVTFPWDMVDAWEGDMWRLIGHDDDAFPWSASQETPQYIYGHHLLIDLVDFADVLSMAGIKLRLWGIGSSLTGTSNGDFPYQTATDHRISGPVELHGPDGVYDHYTEPSGCLVLNDNDNFPHVFRSVPTQDIYHSDSGKRVFVYSTQATGSGAHWP